MVGTVVQSLTLVGHPWARSLTRACHLAPTCSIFTRSLSSQQTVKSAVSDEQVAHFRKHGYVAVANFWTSEEIKGIRGALNALVATGRLANVATDGDGVTHTDTPRNLQLCPISPEHPLFRSLPLHPRVGDAMQRLLCTDPEKQSTVCYLSQTFWKPAKVGLGTGWHQDNAYFQVKDGMAGTAMWTAVHDATIANGTIEVLPDCKEDLPHKRDMTSDHHITCVDSLDESKAVPVELPAGGVLFFAFSTPHCTRANNTDKARAGVAYHFLRHDWYKDRAFPLPEGTEWKTPVVSGPLYQGGAEAYGKRVDTWDEDLAETLKQASELDVASREVKARLAKQDRATI